jgi:hypothetical protein
LNDEVGEHLPRHPGQAGCESSREYTQEDNHRYVCCSDGLEGRLLITRVELQSGTSDVGDRSSLAKALVDDLANGEGSVEPICKSWDVQSTSFFPSPATVMTLIHVIAYESALECIKILSRSQAGSSYLASATGIKVLQFHAQTPSTNSNPKTPIAAKSQHLAVSAICNTLLLHQSAPSICAKAGLGDWALRELVRISEGEGDEMWSFLMGRVVMVLTSRAGYGFLERMVDELSGLTVLHDVGVPSFGTGRLLTGVCPALTRRYPISGTFFPCARGIPEDPVSCFCSLPRNAESTMG